MCLSFCVIAVVERKQSKPPISKIFLLHIGFDTAANEHRRLLNQRITLTVTEFLPGVWQL